MRESYNSTLQIVSVEGVSPGSSFTYTVDVNTREGHTMRFIGVVPAQGRRQDGVFKVAANVNSVHPCAFVNGMLQAFIIEDDAAGCEP